MSSTYIRSEKQASEPTKPNEEKITPHSNTDASEVEVPFSSYKQEHKKPYTAEYFKLGDVWNADSGFSDDVEKIEQYFIHQTEQGELENTTEAVKESLKRIEKMTGVDATERMVVKLAKIAAYINFLKESKSIEKMAGKYGTN